MYKGIGGHLRNPAEKSCRVSLLLKKGIGVNFSKMFQEVNSIIEKRRNIKVTDSMEMINYLLLDACFSSGALIIITQPHCLKSDKDNYFTWIRPIKQN